MNLKKKTGGLTLLNLFVAGAAVLFAALFLFMFLGAFVVLGNASLSGNDLAFDVGVGGVTTGWVFGLVGLILVIAAVILGLLNLKLPKVVVPAVFAFAGMLFLVAGILVFCAASFLNTGFITYNLGVAAVFGGIFGILGACSGCTAALLAFKA